MFHHAELNKKITRWAKNKFINHALQAEIFDNSDNFLIPKSGYDFLCNPFMAFKTNNFIFNESYVKRSCNKSENVLRHALPRGPSFSLNQYQLLYRPLVATNRHYSRKVTKPRSACRVLSLYAHNYSGVLLNGLERAVLFLVL